MSEPAATHPLGPISPTTFPPRARLSPPRSLGLVILEVAANIILPENGQSWHKLRQGEIDECFVDAPVAISAPLRDLIASMLHPVPEMRPSAAGILAHPCVAAVLGPGAPGGEGGGGGGSGGVQPDG
jgi:hypothetical protein